MKCVVLCPSICLPGDDSLTARSSQPLGLGLDCGLRNGDTGDSDRQIYRTQDRGHKTK